MKPETAKDSSRGKSWPLAICNETFAGWPHERICSFIADLGYAGLEVAPFTIHSDVTQVSGGDRRRLRVDAERAGIQIVGLHWLLAKTTGLHLTSPDGETRRRTAVYLRELAGFCADLGGSVMVFGSPQQRNLLPGVEAAQAERWAVEVLQSILPTLEQRGVTLALEPLAPQATTFLTTAAEAVRVIQQVASKHCRLLLDCKAMSSESRPIPDLIREHARWLAHFHANDPNSLGPGMGQLDFAPILRSLADADYRGWISVEVFDTSPGAERIARESLECLRRAAAGAGEAR